MSDMDADSESLTEEEYALRFFESDLSQLPAARPPRHPALMMAVVVFSGLLMWVFADDTAYFMASAKPKDLGDTVQFHSEFRADPSHVPAGLTHNLHLEAKGLSAFRTVSEDGKQAFFKLAYVPLYVHDRSSGERRPSDMLEHVTVSGRLLQLSRTTRYSSLQRYYGQRFDLPMHNAFVLVEGDLPSDYWWTIPLQLMFLGFILANLWMLFRSMRA